MGIMVDGEWDPDHDRPSDTDPDGFEREETSFRDGIEPGGDHPPEPDRYHLYISRACPWAHRTMVVRALKGLEGAVSVDIVDPIRFDEGWQFTPEKDDCTPDTVNGSSYLREVYAKANPNYTGRVSVPVLWDRKEETIVNNESSEIIQLVDGGLDEFATRDVTLFPDDLPVVETMEEIYDPINNGVYKTGFAGGQEPYDRAVTDLFDAMERWNERLGEQRYLCGEQLTAADVCMFTTMYRFDEIYHTHFKCNVSRLVDLSNLWGHTREIYQLPGVAATCNMDHCKEHYYRTHLGINPTGIVAKGPDPDFDRPHGRETVPGTPPESLIPA